MVFAGQAFTEEVIDRVRGLLAADPGVTRTALSRRVCEALDWRDRDGHLREFHCRVALLKLARRNLITLPPAGVNPFGRGPLSITAAQLPLPRVEGKLSDLGGVWLEVVDRRDEARSRLWWAMMNAHHPLGGGPLCGAQIRYFVVSSAGCLGGLSFSAAAWRLAARDGWIGWSDEARRTGLGHLINNSRFLLLPSIRVPHLASHVLGLVLRRVAGDWQERYGVRPVLVETYTDQARHRGTCYRAANWQWVGQTEGRGRQDRKRTAKRAVKDVWLYPLVRNWRAVLGGREAPKGGHRTDVGNWAEVEFGQCALGDERLTRRLVTLAQDFYAQPTASIPQACGGDRAKTKAAYRFLDNGRTTMQALLDPHYRATEARMATHQVVLAVQDSTSLNYTAHPATEGLGPIGSSVTAIGLQVHSTLAMTTDGTPLGFVDVQAWARDANAFGQRKTSKKRALEDKESVKWLNSYKATAKVQERLPETMIVSVGDREADIFDLFILERDSASGPKLLMRAMQNRCVKSEQGHLWPTLEAQPPAGLQIIQVPRQGNRPARTAELAVRFAKVELIRPNRCRGKGNVSVWAVLAREEQAPEGVTPLEWMLLTTVPVETFDQAIERLGWYTQRWTIEVLHRILKSGCQVENRQLGHADRIEACLAIDLVVAWRIHHLNKLGRESPDIPCTVYFEDAEWKALVALSTNNPVPPPQPPTLRQAIRLTARLGGFLGRKGDGEPGTQTLWLGLQKLEAATAMWRVMMHMLDGTQVHVSSTDYG
jgi:hypothetical protein